MPLLKLNEILSTDQLTKLGMFLTACRRMQLYLGRMKETASQIAAWQFSIDALPELADEVERCIRGDEVDDRASPELRSVRRQAEIVEAAEILIKYKGYIERERLVADKMHRLEDIHIKGHFNYNELHEISTEGRQKLTRINPETLGQAARIPGVSPSDINVLLVLMKR